jgi:hypothetical protein
MITVKEAVQKAMAFAVDILGAARVVDMRLEEIESTGLVNDPTFEITLSFPNADAGSTLRAFSDAVGNPVRRDYKVFSVSKGSGEVTAMKMRQLTAA